MTSVLDTISCFLISLDIADLRFVIPQVVPPLGVSSVSMQIRTLITILTISRCFTVNRAINIGRIVEIPVFNNTRLAPSLVLEMPIEARERLVFVAFML
jgi:hypothetical protein